MRFGMLAIVVAACRSSSPPPTPPPATGSAITAGATIGRGGSCLHEWCWWNPLPMATSANGAWLSPERTFWVVGDSGLVARSRAGKLEIEDVAPTHLTAVWGTSDRDVWIVGGGNTILHFDGSAWSSRSDASDHVDWRGVHGTGPADVWIVGQAGEYAGLAMHWTGRAFERFPVDGEPRLGAVFADGHDVWFGGISKVGKLAGRRIAPIAAPAGGLTGVETIAANADGDLFATQNDGETWHRHGDAWDKLELDDGRSISKPIYIRDGAHLYVMTAGATYEWGGGRFAIVAKHPTDASRIWPVATSGRFAIGRRIYAPGDDAPLGAKDVRERIVGVWAHDVGDVWVAGEHGRLAHWTGAAWAGGSGVELHALSAMVGDGDRAYACNRNGTIAMFADGVWEELTSPTTEALSQISAHAGDVWFAGEHGTIVHLESKTAKLVATPAGTGTIASLWAASPRDAWAVDGAHLLHWDGTTWTASATGAFSAVWGRSAADVWLGTTAGLRHWDGTAWTDVTGYPGGGVAQITGDATELDVASGGTIATFDGATWKTSTPPPGGNPATAHLDRFGFWLVGQDGAVVVRAR